MRSMIEELREFQRRFNFEIENFVKKVEELKENKFNDPITIKNENKNFAEKFVSIKRLAEIYPSFTQGSIRHLNFTGAWNFINECTCRTGKKVLIDIEAFEKWIKKPKHKDEKYKHLG